MTIVLLKGGSQYGVLPYFIQETAEAFAARGYQTHIEDVGLWEGPEVFTAHMKALTPIDFVFSVNVFGEFRNAAGETVSQICHAPHVIQYVDWPLHQSHLARLDKTPGSTALLLVDPSHIDDIEQVYGPDHFSHLAFNPHAGVGAPYPIPEDPEAYAEGRPVAAMFAASYSPAGEPPWSAFPTPVKNVFIDAADMALARETVSFREAIDAALMARGVAVKNNPEVMRPIWRQAYLVEQWVRVRRRQAFFAAAARVGLPLVIFGKGYEEAEHYPTFQYYGPVDFNNVLGVMRQSRISFNATAMFGRGAHERPFCAMLAGSVAASDYTRYFAEHFEAGRDIALFRWTSLDEDLAAIRELLNDPAALHTIAKAGQEKAQREHRWANRIDAILAAAEAARHRMAAEL